MADVTLRRIDAAPIWSLAREAPGLAAALERADPWAAAAAGELSDHALAAPTCAPFDGGGHTRPVGHMRSFYREGAVGRIAFKGTEIHAGDLFECLATVSQFRSVDPHPPHMTTSLLSLSDRFAIMEHKAPGVVLLGEALAEATSAATFQAAYLARYAGLARVPVPLHVYRWSDADAARYLAGIEPMVTVRSRPIIRRLVAEGLGAIVYYYPGHGPRVSGVGLEMPELYRDFTLRISHPDRLARLEERYGVREAFGRWLQLVSRMLALGFFPNDPYGNYLLGESVQWQNAVLDGGFVDVDSITPMASIEGEQAFTETFAAMVVEMATTFRKLFLGPVPHANLEYKDPSLTTAMLVLAVWDGVRAGVRRERDGAGGIADGRLSRLLEDRDPYAFLTDVLAAMHPRPRVGGPGLQHMGAFY